jgi:hypothetical protein
LPLREAAVLQFSRGADSQRILQIFGKPHGYGGNYVNQSAERASQAGILGRESSLSLDLFRIEPVIAFDPCSNRVRVMVSATRDAGDRGAGAYFSDRRDDLGRVWADIFHTSALRITPSAKRQR